MATTAKSYIANGVHAISVLTDSAFDGSIEDLKQVTQALRHTPIPVLRKDFIFSPQQIIESKLAGADVILLMVSVLGDKTRAMVEFAHQCGLETLVEVHALAELDIALNAGSDVIGVNQRDLTTFNLYPETFAAILSHLPSSTVKIAESGIKSYAVAQQLFALGYHGVLVGQALSQLKNPAQFFNESLNNVN
jgi:indole-3-glycerol phosphate synthase